MLELQVAINCELKTDEEYNRKRNSKKDSKRKLKLFFEIAFYLLLVISNYLCVKWMQISHYTMILLNVKLIKNFWSISYLSGCLL